jgi:hypothetical protein
MRLANGPLPWSWIDPDKALPWVEERIGLALAESQVAAIRLALMSKVLVMTGGPGVGKTTIIAMDLPGWEGEPPMPGARFTSPVPAGSSSIRPMESSETEI